MVNYTVRTTVQNDIYEQYVQWLETEHIHDVIALPGFLGAQLCLRKGGSMEASSKEVVVHYQVQDEAAIQVYFKEHALRLREKGLEKFPGQFSAHREVWLESRNFKSK